MKNKKVMLIALIIIIVLIGLFVTMIIINNLTKEEIPENSFMIKKGDTETIVSLHDLYTLSIENFTNRHNNSRGLNELKNYSGFELKDVLTHYGFSLEGVTTLTLTASDGYNRIYTIEEVLMENNVYITTECEGDALIKGITGGNADDGGPFLMIKRSDEFSNNRVKKFFKVELN